MLRVRVRFRGLGLGDRVSCYSEGLGLGQG